MDSLSGCPKLRPEGTIVFVAPDTVGGEGVPPSLPSFSSPPYLPHPQDDGGEEEKKKIYFYHPPYPRLKSGVNKESVFQTSLVVINHI